jgi:hypothetical protein
MTTERLFVEFDVTQFYEFRLKFHRQDGHLREQQKRQIAYAYMGASTAILRFAIPIV